MYAVKINYAGATCDGKVLRNVQPGQTLLEICLRHNIDLNYNCGGVCSCSTCHIFLHKGQEFIEEKSRREVDFISKTKNEQENSRLACQCILLDNGGEIEFTIPGQTETT